MPSAPRVLGSAIEPRPFIPPSDDLTVSQFILDHSHSVRPPRPLNTPCLVEDTTGHAIYLEELKQRTAAFAACLQHQYGLGKDDVVSFCSPNHIDYGVVCWAVHDIGGIVALMSPMLTPSEMAHQIRLVGPKLVITHPICLNNIQAALAEVNGDEEVNIILIGSASAGISLATLDDLISQAQKSNIARSLKRSQFRPGESKKRIAFLCFSSGTTGPPKAVAVSHYNVFISITQIATHQGVHDPRISADTARFRPGDVCTGVLPFFHIYGLLFNLHFAIFSAMTVVVTSAFNFENLLRNIKQYNINQLYIVPPQATLFAKHPAVRNYDVSGIHCVHLAAAPLSAELTAQLLQLWPNAHFGQGYGMTEAAGGIAMWPFHPKVGTHGAVGTILPSATVKVVKEDGTLAAKGEPGELLVKGDLVTLGYYKNPESTKQTYLEDGWLRTGDEVVFTEKEEMVIVDRIKEIIKVKGLQVSPAELEGHLLSHPDVADVGVVGVRDEYAGQFPVAFVVLKAPAQARAQRSLNDALDLKTELLKHVSDSKAKYKWLREVRFMEAIPRNPSGKILRRVLQGLADNVPPSRKARL